MITNRSIKVDSNNSSTLHFIKSSNFENTTLKTKTHIPNTSHSNSLIFGNISKSLHTPFFNLLNEKSLLNVFECENDLPLAAGEYTFLIYGGQYLTLYNIDGQLYRISWNTNIYDSIKQIRWSSYHHSYLIMTARCFTLFSLFSYELFQIQKSFNSNEQLQYFTCHQADLWLVCLLNVTTRQILVHHDLSEWERNDFDMKNFPLDDLGELHEFRAGLKILVSHLGLYKTDTICAIENNHNGECLGLLIAERNQNLTVGIQRRRRLILLSTYNMSPIRVIYFSGADDLYWTLISINNRQTSNSGWLLSKWFDNELTFVDHKCHCIEYKKELRNLAITINGHYLILRTINSLDIYQID